MKRIGNTRSLLKVSQDKEYKLKSWLATTEVCLHDIKANMKEASYLHKNTMTLIIQWLGLYKIMSSLQANLTGAQSQKANDLAIKIYCYIADFFY